MSAWVKLGGRTSASAERRHWSGRAVRWSSCAILLSISRLSKVQSVDQRIAWNAVSAFANCGRAVAHVRGSYVPILLQKSFWGVERKFLEPLMRFTRGDVRDQSVHPKSITDLRSGVEKRRRSREVQRSTFVRFLGLFDFRLLQQNLPRRNSRIAASVVQITAHAQDLVR